ncbi:MAG: hypothetical protein MPJ78_01170 [Hyphomicrobiaceae bacterium]|nr:hypothetical protein [Hyphomicrobiaceae bacterium]
MQSTTHQQCLFGKFDEECIPQTAAIARSGMNINHGGRERRPEWTGIDEKGEKISGRESKIKEEVRGVSQAIECVERIWCAFCAAGTVHRASL